MSDSEKLQGIKKRKKGPRLTHKKKHTRPPSISPPKNPIVNISTVVNLADSEDSAPPHPPSVVPPPTQAHPQIFEAPPSDHMSAEDFVPPPPYMPDVVKVKHDQIRGWNRPFQAERMQQVALDMVSTYLFFFDICDSTNKPVSFVIPYLDPHHDELLKFATRSDATPRSVYEMACNMCERRELASNEVSLFVKGFFVPRPPVGLWTEFVHSEN